MKKLAVYILVPSLVIGSCTAGVYVYQKKKQENTYVKVISVSNISEYDYGSDMYMYARVVNNQRQQIMVTISQKISEVLVKEGDYVNIGDPILYMDTTMDNINLKDLEIQIQKKILEISDGYKRLDKLMKTTPAAPYNPGGDFGWWDDPEWNDPWIEESSSEEESTEEESTEEESTEDESSEQESIEESTQEPESQEQSTQAEEESPEEESSEESTEENTEEESTQQTSSEIESQEKTTEESSPENTTQESIEPSTEEAIEPTTEPCTEIPEEPTTEEPTEVPTGANGEILIANEISYIEQSSSGNGTKENPYLFLCSEQAKLDNILIKRLVEKKGICIDTFLR